MKKCFLILFVILLLACGKNDASSQNVTETAATPTVATIETQTATPVTESVPAVTENAPPPTENVPAVAETAPPAMENVPTVAETAPTENVVAATENVSPATESVPAVTKVQPAEETAAGTVPVIAPNQDKPVEADKVEAAAGTVPAPKGEDVPARVISVTGQHGDKAVSVEILFTKPVKDGFDPTPYILVRDVAGGTALEVKPAVVKDTIQVRGNFEPDREYEVTVLKGIPAIDDSKTEDDLSGRVRFLEREPKLAFLNEGILLPSTADRSVVLRSLNVTKVRVKVWKVFENNFTQFLHDFYFKENGANSYGNNLLGDWQLPRVAEEVADKEFTINNVKNKWVQSSLSLKGILDGKGIYIVNVSFPRDGISYEFDPNLSEWQRDNLFYRGTIHKAILLTDVALIAQKDGSGKYYVSAVDIPKNAPLPGAKVQLISKTNQILGEKFTDGDGNAVFEDNTKNAFYVVAEHNDKKSLLKLDAPLSMDGFKVGGAFATEGIRAFVFTERGVYRPGDAIHVGIIARNENTVLPDDHPVKITVYTPTGSKYIEDALIKEGKDGFYVWEFATKTEDNTGVWKLSAAIGSHVVTKEILVETVVPYKIQNTVTAPESIAAGDGKFSWTVDSKYLFGAPAAGLAVEGDVIIREEPVEFEQYKNYNFVTPGSYYNVSHESFSGVLDEKGHFSAVTDISNVTYRSLNVLLDLHPRVIEEGGRPVLSRATVKIKKFDNYLGVEKNARYLGNKKPVNIKVVTPSADGEKLTAGRNLEYKVYYNRYSWWWDYNYYEDFIRSIKDDKETEFIASKEFVSTEEPYVIDYVPEEEGEYYLEVTDLETNQTTGTSFYASDWTNPADVVRLNGLKISADKAKYTSADTAVVSFEGIRGAKALIALEKNGKIVSRKIRDIGEELVKEEIELDKSMVPNLYVHVSLLQNYDKKNDRSLRLYGAVPLLIEDEDTKLHISLETPESIRPQETFSVKVKSDKNRKMEYAVAVVDEGLLDLTTFKTPDPWTFFYQKLASRVELFDNYDSIMEKPFGEIHQILQVGGELLERMAMPAARRGADLGFEDAERFKPVSLWQGTLVTNEKGEGTVEFTMPNYMGSVRIMAVAADGPAYGFAEKTMAVKAPVVVLESLPRTLKAGDDFVFPVKVFALEENIGDIEVYYSFNGRTQSQVVNLKKGEEKTVYFSEQIEPAVGLNNVAIGVKSGVYNYEETVEMAVNSDALPVSRSESAMIKDNETATFVQNKNYVKNTVKSSIVISNTPALGIDQRLRYLIAYPYGCVEQTTSAVLPQLFLERLMTDKQYDKKEVIQNINAGIKRLVNNFQTSEGGFSYWPGEHYTDEWGTGYAATFLILARQQGYYVPDNAYSKLLNYLKKRIRERKIPDNSGYGADTYYLMRSYGLYLLALSGSPLLSEMNYTYAGEYDKLNVISKLYLAGAYQLAGEEKTAREILEKSNAKEKILATADVPEYYRYSYGSVLRDLSVYLHIYYTLYGSFDPDALDTVLLWLRSDSWYNTQATAWALLALSNFVEDSSDKNIKGAVVIDGVATTYEGVGATRMTIPETAREVKITPETPGNTFVTYYWEGTPLNEKTENIVKGFTLERKFYDTEGKTINPRELESGRTFWLEVAVTPTTDKRYISKENMALVQILPTGWEIENTRLSGEQNPQWIREKLGNIESCARYMDIRDDRILWFFDYQPYGGAQGSGVYRFFVKINTVTRGTFDFPGTKLEAMYDYNFQSYLNGYPVRVVDKNMPAVAENPDSNK